MIDEEKEDTSYKYMLSKEGRWRRDRRIPRAALRKFKYSSFNYLHKSGNDQALLNATGHDHRSFRLLLNKFKYLYDYYIVDADTGRIRKKIIRADGIPKGKRGELLAFGALGSGGGTPSHTENRNTF